MVGIKGLTERAIATIQVLHLGDNKKNHPALIGKRKQSYDILFWKNGINPAADLEDLEDKKLLERLISDLSKPEQDKMDAFTPVVINMFYNMLSSFLR